MSLKSPLGKIQPEPIDIEAEKRKGWQTLKILVIALDDVRLGWADKELVLRLGNRLYGAEKPIAK